MGPLLRAQFLSRILFPIDRAAELGLNPYDVRKPCDREKNPLCYEQMNWIDTWMNDPQVKVALGVEPTRKFTSCSTAVGLAFGLQGDGAHNSAELLGELVDDGVRLLIYAGNAGMISPSQTSRFPLTGTQT
jgi:cathepsin A (carboxypeptidase C)